ncbi:MAG: hypothetical protein LBU66_08520 [Treponema sp.]|jgi:hypothetical protein|nr:hypothetical protein [Treponema sp.]
MTEKKYLEMVERLGGIITPVRKISFPKLQIKTKNDVVDLLSVMRHEGGDLTNGEVYDLQNHDQLYDKLIATIKKGLTT